MGAHYGFFFGAVGLHVLQWPFTRIETKSLANQKKNGTYHKELLQNQSNDKHISWEAGICEWSTSF